MTCPAKPLSSSYSGRSLILTFSPTPAINYSHLVFRTSIKLIPLSLLPPLFSRCALFAPAPALSSVRLHSHSSSNGKTRSGQLALQTFEERKVAQGEPSTGDSLSTVTCPPKELLLTRESCEQCTSPGDFRSAQHPAAGPCCRNAVGITGQGAQLSFSPLEFLTFSAVDL